MQGICPYGSAWRMLQGRAAAALQVLGAGVLAAMERWAPEGAEVAVFAFLATACVDNRGRPPVPTTQCYLEAKERVAEVADGDGFAIVLASGFWTASAPCDGHHRVNDPLVQPGTVVPAL